jgi:hypothetical protein
MYLLHAMVKESLEQQLQLQLPVMAMAANKETRSTDHEKAMFYKVGIVFWGREISNTQTDCFSGHTVSQ